MTRKETPYLIGLAGPSGAGKTELSYLIKRHSKLFAYIGADNYFNSPDTFPKKFGFPNWELPRNLDFERLARDLKEIKSGKTVITQTLPIETKSGIRRYKLTIKPNRYVIVDGFLIFKNRAVRDLLDLKIYMHIPKKLMLERRKEQFGRLTEYDRKVAVPEFLRHGLDQVKFADYVFNGSTPLRSNRKMLLEILKGNDIHSSHEPMDKGDVVVSIKTEKLSIAKNGV